MAISVIKELYVRAQDKHTGERRSQRYINAVGLTRVEHRSLICEPDWSTADFERFSHDNGRTWGEWKNVNTRAYEKKGEDEINTAYRNEIWNPVHGHFVSVGYQRIFFGGHKEVYKVFWGQGKAGFVDHILMVVREEGSDEHNVEVIKYEPGADYDPDNWRDPDYTHNNIGICGYEVVVMEDGQIVFPIQASVRSCCRILGLDLGEVFPSCPDIMRGLLIVRGRFNQARGNYDLSFSKPVVISDLLSSRGVNEPTAAVLPSGRILAVFRGSNVESENWNTRIEPGAPSHKWYCYSDDGGETFTQPAPWHFNDREVFYSAATISAFVRSIQNGRTYWIGNISGPDTYGNHPRYPLVIAEVDESGLLIHDTMTIIDTREHGDSEKLQLSNFSIIQDRETGRIEVYLAKIGQRENFNWWADCYRYFIKVADEA